MLHEIEHFFHSYNEAKGGEIKVLHRVSAKKAHALLAQALQ
jgi:inorganic pyrophosphatase